VSSVWYELGFYIPEDDILDRHCRLDLKSYKALQFLKFVAQEENVHLIVYY
jgi:hypothetical protein